MNTPKVAVMMITMGNGGAVTARWIVDHKAFGAHLGTDGMQLYVADSDAARLQSTLGNLEEDEEKKGKVTLVNLIEDETRSFGAGGRIENGFKIALERRPYFEELATELAEKKGVLFLYGCLGGGTTGGLPVVAKIFRDKDIFVKAIVTFPKVDEGAERMDNAFTVVRQLQSLGVSVLTTYNGRVVPKGDDPWQSEVHAQMNDESLGPMLTINHNIYNTVGSVQNVDLNDLKAAEGLSSYMGLWNYDSNHCSVEDILKTLSRNPLQDSEEIVSKATHGILCFYGIRSKTIEEVRKNMLERMCSGKKLAIKTHINEIDDNGHKISAEKSWIAFITSTNELFEDIFVEKGYEGLKDPISVSFEPASESAAFVVPAQTLGAIAVEEPEATFAEEAFEPEEVLVPESERVIFEILMVNKTKDRIPKRLQTSPEVKELTDKVRQLGNAVTLEQIDEVHALSAPYIALNPALDGWKIFFHQEGNLRTPTSFFPTSTEHGRDTDVAA
jgi:cell division GTPase FtsZ